MRFRTYENSARLLFHLNGWSVIQLTDVPGPPQFEVLTHQIPLEHRQLGSEFRIRWRAIYPDPTDTIDELRAATSQWLEFV
jgi:hypothetical protein